MQYIFMDTKGCPHPQNALLPPPSGGQNQQGTGLLPGDSYHYLAPIEGRILLGELGLMRNICKAHHMRLKDRSDALPGQDRRAHP